MGLTPTNTCECSLSFTGSNQCLYSQWMEKMPDGSNVFRNTRVEEREAQRFEQERQRRREALFSRVQEEFEKESSEPGKGTQLLKH